MFGCDWWKAVCFHFWICVTNKMGVGGSVMGYWECMGQGVSNLSKCCTSNGNDDKMNSVLDRMKSCCGSESPDEAEGKSKTKRRTFKGLILFYFFSYSNELEITGSNECTE